MKKINLKAVLWVSLGFSILAILLGIFNYDRISTLEREVRVLQGSVQELQEEIGFPPEERCVQSGGKWTEFPNACADTCEFVRGEVDICAQVITESCDCGPNRCWNGMSCELN